MGIKWCPLISVEHRSRGFLQTYISDYSVQWVDQDKVEGWVGGRGQTDLKEKHKTILGLFIISHMHLIIGRVAKLHMNFTLKCWLLWGLRRKQETKQSIMSSTSAFWLPVPLQKGLAGLNSSAWWRGRANLRSHMTTSCLRWVKSQQGRETMSHLKCDLKWQHLDYMSVPFPRRCPSEKHTMEPITSHLQGCLTRVNEPLPLPQWPIQSTLTCCHSAMITFRSMTMDWTRRKMVEWSSQLMYVDALHSLTQAMAALSISCLLPPWPAKAFRKLSRNSFWQSQGTGSSVSASASECVYLHVCVSFVFSISHLVGLTLLHCVFGDGVCDLRAEDEKDYLQWPNSCLPFGALRKVVHEVK